MRGKLTDEITKVSETFLGRKITTAELRLYAYLDYVMKNEQKLQIERVNQEDREILNILKKEGHIDGGATGLSMTKQFYDYVQEVLWLGYVIGGWNENLCNSQSRISL